MSQNIDIKLSQTADDVFDLSVGSGGDLTIDNGFDTAIYLSLFTDKRAAESEITKPQMRGGWWGNTLADPPFEIGSKLWLLDNRRTQNTLNKAIDFTRECLQWFIDEGFCKTINVTAEFIAEGLQLTIQFFYKNGSSETKLFEAWGATEIT